MAAIIACADYILLTNGTDAGLVHYSAPKEFRRLPIPSFQAASRGDPSQASLARKKGAGTEKPQDGGAASKTNAAEIGAGADAQDSIPAAEIKGDVGFDNNSSSAGKAQQNYVRALAISHTGSHVALCDDRKYFHVFQIASSGQVSIVSSRLSGPLSGQGTSGLARTRDRRVSADYRMYSLSTSPPTPPYGAARERSLSFLTGGTDPDLTIAVASLAIRYSALPFFHPLLKHINLSISR
ncbi:hypothetical protein PoB_002658600 [Plakobranchus ocellatus]|uniref:Uncharacterized protein n=1 Tax=Plakobranchus ocellatus TaxID=259542 RepID=A0AAV3ZVW8_9GAST|nr:hypothetical protein PoB_002658600 [Plakobranchus ocellatus]